MLSSELVRSVLDSAPDAMIVIDPDGRILFANHQVATLFGHPPDEVVGERVEFLMPERFRQRHVAHRRRYAESVRLRPMGIGLDLFARRKDGTEFPVEISLSPVKDGEKMLTAAAIRDATDRVRSEQQLRGPARKPIARTGPRAVSWPQRVTIYVNRCKHSGF